MDDDASQTTVNLISPIVVTLGQPVEAVRILRRRGELIEEFAVRVARGGGS